MIFGLSFFSGSAIKGVEFALGFGIGTIPLLWLAQSKLFVLQQRLGAIGLGRLQRWVAICAMLVIMWRLRTTLGIEGADQWICHPF
jgi:sulfite exporter TauE/SafE